MHLNMHLIVKGRRANLFDTSIFRQCQVQILAKILVDPKIIFLSKIFGRNNIFLARKLCVKVTLHKTVSHCACLDFRFY